MTAVSVLVGTTKGAFVLRPDGAGQDWTPSGPHCGGWPVNHMIGDPATGMIRAAGGSDWTGAGVWRSADSGQTWTMSKLSDGKLDAWSSSDDGGIISMRLPSIC